MTSKHLVICLRLSRWREDQRVPPRPGTGWRARSRSCVRPRVVAAVPLIHPNTLRQRVARIEELTGLDLDQDDLLSLELAIKLVRLHGRPARAAGGP